MVAGRRAGGGVVGGRRGGDPPRPDQVAIAYGKLAAAHANSDDLPAAAATLTDAITELAPTGELPLLLLELRVRHTTVHLLSDGDNPPPPSTADPDDIDAARISHIVAVITEIQNGNHLDVTRSDTLQLLLEDAEHSSGEL